MASNTQLISIIVPVFNEEANLRPLYETILKAVKNVQHDIELLFVNDGSSDESGDRISELQDSDTRVRHIELARNFGKEIALSAGLQEARGDAAVMLDADMQHPPQLLQQFVEEWEAGADVVIGVRDGYKQSFVKRLGSKAFYFLMHHMSETEVIAHATDYRLVDRQVIDAFNRFTERNRITRGLFDWLGYRKAFVQFDAPPRLHGEAKYSLRKLLKLSVNTFVGHSMLPLKLAGYLGTIIVAISGPLGAFVLLQKYVLNDPENYGFSGSAALAIVNLFMSGIVLMCLGLIALYIATIHKEVTNRPLYVLRTRRKPVMKELRNHSPITVHAAKTAQPSTRARRSLRSGSRKPGNVRQSRSAQA